MPRQDDRIELPPLEPRIEPLELVRERANRRARGISALMCGLLFLVGARGAELSLAPSDQTLRQAAVQRWDQVTLRARRGEVLDRNGHRLATSVATPNVVVDPTRVSEEERPALAATLSAMLGVPQAEILDKLGRESRYQRLAVQVHPSVAASIEALDDDALWIEREPRR